MQEGSPELEASGPGHPGWCATGWAEGGGGSDTG